MVLRYTIHEFPRNPRCLEEALTCGGSRVQQVQERLQNNGLEHRVFRGVRLVVEPAQHAAAVAALQAHTHAEDLQLRHVLVAVEFQCCFTSA